jgi:hypothetical protein
MPYVMRRIIKFHANVLIILNQIQLPIKDVFECQQFAIQQMIVAKDTIALATNALCHAQIVVKINAQKVKDVQVMEMANFIALKFVTRATIVYKVKFVLNQEFVSLAVYPMPIAHSHKFAISHSANATKDLLTRQMDVLILMNVPKILVIRQQFVKTRPVHIDAVVLNLQLAIRSLVDVRNRTNVDAMKIVPTRHRAIKESAAICVHCRSRSAEPMPIAKSTTTLHVS